jgi:hypothetical protein
MITKYVIRDLTTLHYYSGIASDFVDIEHAKRYNNDIDGGELMKTMYWISLIRPCEIVKIYEHE